MMITSQFLLDSGERGVVLEDVLLVVDGVVMNLTCCCLPLPAALVVVAAAVALVGVVVVPSVSIEVSLGNEAIRLSSMVVDL